MKELITIGIAMAGLLIMPANADAKKKKVAEESCSDRCLMIDSALRAEIAETPGKSGGIYYAYPYLNTPDSMAPVPAGFEPVYISHYGRHGSRWHTTKDLYKKALAALSAEEKAGNLTADGMEFMKVVKQYQEDADGHVGELTPLGNRQHRMIATRMISRFPGLFQKGDTIIARSSLEPRCIISMSSFLDALKEREPGLVINRYATPSDESFIRYHSPEAKALYYDPQPWRPAYEHARDSLFSAPATAARLFKDPGKVKKLPSLMSKLHNIAMASQNIDTQNVNLFPYFDNEDLFNLWKGEDHKHYIRHANSLDGDSLGPKAAKNLLTDILDRADESLAGQRTAVDLRFGHDVYLLRLLAKMEVEGACASARGIDAAARVWQTYSLTPMGANLQITIFRNGAGEEIATVRLNERPVKVGSLKEFAPGYYSWPELRAFWRGK